MNRNLKNITMVPVAILLLFSTNCSPLGGKQSDGITAQSLDPAAYQALEDSVETTFSNRCVTCHSSAIGSSNQPFLNNLDDLKSDQIYVKKGSPETSAIFILVSKSVMHEGQPSLNTEAPAEVIAIRDWIAYMQ